MRSVSVILLSLLIACGFAKAQAVEVYEQIPYGRVTATASSQTDGVPAGLAADGSGMAGPYLQSHNLGHNMWLSAPSTKKVRAHRNTRQGVVWFMTSFDRVEKSVDNIRIWNHNQNQHTARGLKKVYIEYSEDGERWTLLRDGGNEYFIIPQAKGRKAEPASISIKTGGIDFKYLCITADTVEGNHYRDSNPLTIRQAEDLRQNIDYYGLGQISFYRLEEADAASLPQIENILFVPSQGYLRTPDGPAREFTAILPAPVYSACNLTVAGGGRQSVLEIPPSPEGTTRVVGTFPPGYMDEPVPTTLTFESPQGNVTLECVVPPARRWTLYFLPHSHLDIGYTHHQDEVMELQWRNIDRALELIDRTRDYPEGSRFKWNAEATWPVRGYLDRYCGSGRERMFLDAARSGDMGLDATLGSILTGISKQEEMMHYFDDAHWLADKVGIEINTAMMSDLPGQSWGLVTAMAQNGVRYFSSGPNYVPYLGRLGSHGVGLYNLVWGDVPFWWQSQSGEDKILYWQTGKGYSMFHGWLMDKLSVCGTEPVWDYLEELEHKQYPYDLTYLRYTVHGDNGPPDESMPDVIRDWNERYESPRFVIGTTKELFTEMEARYGDCLPVFAGDMTPVWEDGAASTARETAVNRHSAERLNQSEILWSMLHPAEDFPREEFYEGWKNTVLFSEHTWGAAGSGPEPEAEFTRKLWDKKKSYADTAEVVSGRLFELSTAPLGGEEIHGYSFVNVANTQVYPVSDIVTVRNADLEGKMLRAPSGESLPLQRRHDGSWIFYARELPALSVVSYEIVPVPESLPEGPSAGQNTLGNGRIKLEIDSLSGAISSFVTLADGYEFSSEEGLNSYLYSGRDVEEGHGIEQIRAITVTEQGPVAATLRIESDAPGCRSLIRDVTVYRDIDRVDIVNTVDKLNVYDKENVRFVFPFNFFNPEISLDVAMSEVNPERDQLAGSNKNFYSILNAISVRDIERGIYLSSVDAPFVELGAPTADLFRQHREARGWLNSAVISPKIYSWVMNNRWGTNYKASQHGIAVFRYSLQPYHPYNHDMKRYGAAQAQKPVAAASPRPAETGSMFRVKGNNIISLSTIRPCADGSGYIVRLQNNSSNSVKASIEWGSITPSTVFICDNTENRVGDFDSESFWMKPYGCITLKLIVKTHNR